MGRALGISLRKAGVEDRLQASQVAEHHSLSRSAVWGPGPHAETWVATVNKLGVGEGRQNTLQVTVVELGLLMCCQVMPKDVASPAF